MNSNDKAFEDFVKARLGPAMQSNKAAAEALADELWNLYEALENKGFDSYQAFELVREGIRATASMR
jgi:predicted HAD superfamily Cof-like phosphohydrolase